MAKEIKTDKLFVNKVFENWFRIPEYQRPYVWERDHVLELLEDVNTAMQDDSESEYFLGSIVFNIKENSKNNQKLGNTQKINIPKHISVEHILPQNPKEGSQWRKDFNEKEREEWTDKLGNLVLLSRIKNSSLSRRDFKEKKEKYFKKSIEVFPCVSKIMQNTVWNMETLKQNQEDQLNLLLESYN